MKYVLDSSVAVKFVLPEPDSGKAIRLLDEYSKALHELIAPDIFSTEVANALVSAERSARIKKGERAINARHRTSASGARMSRRTMRGGNRSNPRPFTRLRGRISPQDFGTGRVERYSPAARCARAIRPATARKSR